MAPPSGESLIVLMMLATRALGTSQRGLAEILGLSRRTISRWVKSGSPVVLPGHIDTLARAVHARDPALAARIVAVRGATLVDAGIGPEPVPAPPPPPPPYLVDVVVCAAAEALDVSPRVVRPALLAAFQRARAVGLDVAALESSLSKPSPPEPAQPRQRPAARGA
jgi:transcriptional regulator with XRE-family HTH domain